MVQSLFDVLDFRANDVPWRPWRAGGTWGVVDPSGCFGQPILNAQGVSVRIIAAAYATNGNKTDRVARWFDLPVETAEVAIRYEVGARLAA